MRVLLASAAVLVLTSRSLSAAPSHSESRTITQFFLDRAIIEPEERNASDRISGLKYVFSDLSSLERTNFLSANCESAALRLFSPASYSALKEIFEALTRGKLPNAIVLGEAGVGKTHLENQIALLTIGCAPEELVKILNATNQASPVYRRLFQFSGANVISLDASLLSRDPKKAEGALKGSDQRQIDNLNAIILEATQKFQKHGVRTIFLLNEFAQLPEPVRLTLKAIIDRQDFSIRVEGKELTPKNRQDPGFHFVAFCTPNDFNKLSNGDNQLPRRFKTIPIAEPDRAESQKIFNHSLAQIKVDNEDQLGLSLEVEPAVFDLLYEMRSLLSWPPQAAPASVLMGLNDLVSWKINNSDYSSYTAETKGTLRVTAEDTHAFFVDRLHLSPRWFKPFFGDLAEQLKSRVFGIDSVIDELVAELEAWRLTRFGSTPPIFMIGGATGSGKTTLVRELNKLLFGPESEPVTIDMSNSEGFALSAAFFGPPKGNHADGELPHVIKALDQRHGNALILLDEAADAHTKELVMLKLLLETGVVSPAGLDQRPRQLRYPVFLAGEWGSDLINYNFTAEQQNEEIAKIVANPRKLEGIFTSGRKLPDGSKVGQLTPALYNRIMRNGGVFLLPRVNNTALKQIGVKQIAKKVKAWTDRKQVAVELSKESFQKIDEQIEKRELDSRTAESFVGKILDRVTSIANKKLDGLIAGTKLYLEIIDFDAAGRARSKVTYQDQQGDALESPFEINTALSVNVSDGCSGSFSL